MKRAFLCAVVLAQIFASSARAQTCFGNAEETRTALNQLTLDFACSRLDQTGCRESLGIGIPAGAAVAAAAADRITRTRLPSEPPICAPGAGRAGAYLMFLESEARARDAIGSPGCTLNSGDWLRRNHERDVRANIAQLRAQSLSEVVRIDSEIEKLSRAGERLAPAQARARELEEAVDRLRREVGNVTGYVGSTIQGFEQMRPSWQSYAQTRSDDPTIRWLNGVILERTSLEAIRENPYTVRNDVLQAILDNVPEQDRAQFFQAFDRGASNTGNLALGKAAQLSATERALREARASVTSLERSVGVDDAAAARLAALQAARSTAQGRLGALAAADLRFAEVANLPTSAPAARIQASARAIASMREIAPDSSLISAFAERFENAFPETKALVSGTAGVAARAAGSTASRMASSRAAMFLGGAAIGLGVGGPALAGQTVAIGFLPGSAGNCGNLAQPYFTWGSDCTPSAGTDEQTAAFLALDPQMQEAILRNSPAACGLMRIAAGRISQVNWRGQCRAGGYSVLRRSTSSGNGARNRGITQDVQLDPASGQPRTIGLILQTGETRRCAAASIDGASLRAIGASESGSSATDPCQGVDRRIVASAAAAQGGEAVAWNGLQTEYRESARAHAMIASCCSGQLECGECRGYDLQGCSGQGAGARPGDGVEVER